MKEYDIHERIFNFVVKAVKFLNKIPKTPTNLIIINQLTRSITSMGANDQEADGAFTKKEFVHGFTIVRREGKESVFWLRLINVINDKRFRDECNELISEGKEIVAIVSKIMLNAMKSKTERK